MGASFRNIDQIRALSGCDLLTISPELLEQLQQTEDDLITQLSISKAKSIQHSILTCEEKDFRYTMQEDVMASEKLAEGIQNFINDTKQLKDLLRKWH
jgi:transaldolase